MQFFSLENERGRQEQLARERIAARKKKLDEQRVAKENEEGDLEKSKEEEKKLAEEASIDKLDDLSEVEQLQREGINIRSCRFLAHLFYFLILKTFRFILATKNYIL